MNARPLLAALLCVFAVALSACGGSSPPQMTPASQSQAPTRTADEPGAGGTPAKGSTGQSASAGPIHSPPAAAGTTAAAKAFVEPEGDNSIPEYGAEAERSERSRAEASLGVYLAARAKGKWAAACRNLAASLRAQLENLSGARGCPPAYRALSASTPPSAREDPLTHGLLALRIKGKSAFALFYGPSGEGEKYVMPMALEKGAWKATQIAPIPYPLGSQSATPP